MANEFDPNAEGRKLVGLAEREVSADRKSEQHPHRAAFARADERAHNAFYDELNSLSFERFKQVAAADKRIHLEEVPAGTGTAEMHSVNNCLASVSVDAFSRSKKPRSVSELIIKCENQR